MAMDPISIILIDDHAVVREGYRRLLEGDSHLHVLAEGDNGNVNINLML